MQLSPMSRSSLHSPMILQDASVHRQTVIDNSPRHVFGKEFSSFVQERAEDMSQLIDRNIAQIKENRTILV